MHEINKEIRTEPANTELGTLVEKLPPAYSKIAQYLLTSTAPKDAVEAMLLIQMGLSYKFIMEAIQKVDNPFFGDPGAPKTIEKYSHIFLEQVKTLSQYKKSTNSSSPSINVNTVMADKAIVSGDALKS